MAKERSEIKETDKWNVMALYPNLEAWEKDFQAFAGEKKEGVRWPVLKDQKGKLEQDAGTLKSLLTQMFNLERKLIKLYTYAHLRHDEDVANETYKEAYDRISLLYYDFQHETSWIQPEILQLSDETFNRYLKDSELKEYLIYLNKLFVLKPYTLTTDKEHLMALASKALNTSERTFGVFNNADLSFAAVQDKEGREKELTHGTYSLYLQSKDRTLRKNAFVEMHRKYGEFENTVAELINGQIQKHLFESKARGYPSCLHAALTVHQIDTQVYHNLIDTVRENISSLHSYMEMRKKRLKVDTLHFHDIHVSLVPKFEKKYTFEEAKNCVLESVAPLGSDYQEILKRGLEQEGWVDRFENARKRSGAYSSGCYDSFPYILMNFQGTLRDVMTLCHEGGHSMHSYYSNQGQPYHYAHYPIFVAEVASTFNEELLFRYLLERTQSKEEKAYLINQKLDDIRATLFRQTQFAEFELRLHDLAEKGIPLTAANLKSEYRKLNEDYYGPALTVDPEIDVECLRIPHFYYNFYVYQYATGISAAYALVEHLMKEGEKARKDYLNFLSSGSSQYPLELLQMAGVDMHKAEPIHALIKRFSELVSEFDSL